MLQPCIVKGNQEIGVEYAPKANPGDIKEHGYQLHPDRKEAEINDPWWKSLLVKDPTGNEKPGIDLH
jgi:hypothetical protein